MAGQPSTDLAEVDVNDPCAVCAALKAAFLRVIGGLNEIRVRFRNGESEEEVAYGPANIAALKMEMSRQDALCTTKLTGRSPRFAFRAG